MTRLPLNVAVPWSLSHYIPLNGFHPLYRALFDHTPKNITLSAWDNVRLYHRFRSDIPTRTKLVNQAEGLNSVGGREPVAKRHLEYFWPPNQVLTAELPGDIEFHHTAPFPSLSRPFVFHCESFAPVLIPFAHQGSGSLDDPLEVREYYRSIFASQLCLVFFLIYPKLSKRSASFFPIPRLTKSSSLQRLG